MHSDYCQNVPEILDGRGAAGGTVSEGAAAHSMQLVAIRNSPLTAEDIVEG
jgi:hypothetical protein